MQVPWQQMDQVAHTLAVVNQQFQSQLLEGGAASTLKT